MVHKQAHKEGFALLLAIVIASILLSIGLTLLTTTVKQLTLSSTARESEIAFHAASAGIECVRFHRGENVGDQFTDEVIGLGVAPSISCFGVTSGSANTQNRLSRDTDGYTNVFNYELDWTSDERCSQLDLYVMVGEYDNYTFDFDPYSTAVGNKTCPQGAACTVAIVRGYNRSCDDLANGLATVERELTAQF